jgi:hypothetical protein
LYSRLGLEEFYRVEGPAPTSLITFKILVPLLWPEYGVTHSTSNPNGDDDYDYWSAFARSDTAVAASTPWPMQPVVGAPHILVGV